jgi:methyl-accepting chemotaxis protein
MSRKLWFRFALKLTLVVLAVGFLMAYSTYRQKTVEIQNACRVQVADIALALGESTEECLRDGRLNDLASQTSSLRSKLNSPYVALLDSHGEAIMEDAEPGFQPPEEKRLGGIQTVLDGAFVKPVPISTNQTPFLLITVPVSSLHNFKGVFQAVLPMPDVRHEALHALVPILIWTGILLLALYGVVLPSFQRMVYQPLREMREEWAAIGSGEADLTRKMSAKSDDEVGEMAEAFNQFVDNIRDLILTVRQQADLVVQQVKALSSNTQELRSMSEEVTMTVQQVSKGAEEQAIKVSNVNENMQKMVDAMRDVATQSTESANEATQASETARDGGTLARGTMERMTRLNTTLKHSVGVMVQLHEKGRQIGRVVDLISGIAGQTNLLALNAAIEAARAGEQGRGFAVVAEEIRKLAEESANATKEIAAVASQIREETQSAVESMETGASESEEARKAVQQMGDSLEEIIKVINKVDERGRQISGLAEHHRRGADQALQNIQEISAVSEEYAASTEEMSSSTQAHAASLESISTALNELNRIAHDLKLMVEKFKV